MVFVVVLVVVSVVAVVGALLEPNFENSFILGSSVFVAVPCFVFAVVLLDVLMDVVRCFSCFCSGTVREHEFDRRTCAKLFEGNYTSQKKTVQNALPYRDSNARLLGTDSRLTGGFTVR